MYLLFKKISIIIFILVIHVDMFSQQIELLALYDTSNTNLKSDYITCVTKDSAGNLWIGTYRDGIAQYNGTKWIVYDTTNSDIGSNNINDIIVLKSGDIWIATEDNGISVFDGNQWSVYNTSNCELSGNNIYEMIQDDDGNIWVGIEDKSLMMFDGDSWLTFSNMRADDIYLDFHNNLWLINNKIFVWYHQSKTWDSINIYEEAHRIYNIIADKNGIIWLSANFWSSDYILSYDGLNWEKYTPANSGLGSFIYYNGIITVDDNNNKWFISNYGKISKFDGRNWLNYDNYGLFTNGAPTDFYIDEENILWFATQAGLLKVKEKNYFFDMNENLIFESFIIYPNPTNNIITINSPPEKIKSYYLYNLSGKLLREKHQINDHLFKIDLQKFSNGIYLLKLCFENQVITKEILIQ